MSVAEACFGILLRIILITVAATVIVSVPAAAQDILYPYDRVHRGEPAALSDAAGRVRRQGNVLRLLARDREVVFENIEYCEDREDVCRARQVRDCQHNVTDCRVFSLLRHDRKARAFLVYVSFYEDFRVLWVDDRTGKITDIGGLPHLSPDGVYFAVAQRMDCCGTSYSGIQVRRTNGALLEFEEKFEELDRNSAEKIYRRIYFDFKEWIGRDSFLLKMQWEEKDPPSGLGKAVTGTALVARKEGRWRLVLSPPEFPTVTECVQRPNPNATDVEISINYAARLIQICTDRGP